MIKQVIFLVFLFWIAALSADAQLVSNAQAALLKDENIFDERFIRNNNIKLISGRISIKKELQPINDIGTLIQFRFNEEGKLIEKTTTLYNYWGERDTSSIRFDYDDVNRLIESTSMSVGGFQSTRYHYDDMGRIAQKHRFKGENLAQFKYQFQAGKPFRVAGDSLEYIELDSMKTLINVFNEQGLKYKSVILEQNALGLPVKEIERFTVTNSRKETSYTYNDFGQLIQVQVNSNIGGKKDETFSYTYQEDGNVYDEKYTKNGKLEIRREFLYDPNTSLLKAELIKKQQLNDIKIIQYNYTFFGDAEEENPTDSLATPKMR